MKTEGEFDGTHRKCLTSSANEMKFIFCNVDAATVRPWQCRKQIESLFLWQPLMQIESLLEIHTTTAWKWVTQTLSLKSFEHDIIYLFIYFLSIFQVILVYKVAGLESFAQSKD